MRSPLPLIRLFVEDLIVTLQEQALLKVVPQTRLAKTSCLLPPLLLITAYPEGDSVFRSAWRNRDKDWFEDCTFSLKCPSRELAFPL